MNLLDETLSVMGSYDLTPEDIIFIGSLSGYSCTWDEYVLLADKKYDSGYGKQEVAEDLVIAFKGGIRFERGEYDGSEWWDVIVPFEMPKEKKKITNLFTVNDKLGAKED